MTETKRQTISVDGVSRVTFDISGADISVRWVEQLEEISIIGAELPIDRAGDELFIRSDLRGGRNEDADIEIRIPNFESPSQIVEDILKQTGIFAGFGRKSKGVPLHIQIPVSIQSTSLEITQGDLGLENPQNKVECKLKRGDFGCSGGRAELTVQAGTGNAHISRIEGSVRATGGSGDISITDSDAIVNVKAGSGEISLSKVTGDAIKLTAGSGEIVVRECIAQAYSSECGSGDVRIDGGRLERISVRTGSGDITCTATFGAFNQAFVSGSGEISLGVPRNLPARIEAFTSSGEIDTELPLVSVRQRGPKSWKSRRQVGSVGTGEPRAEVSVRTSSGDLRVHWLQTSVGYGIPAPSPVPQPPSVPDIPSVPKAPETPEAPERSSGEPVHSGDKQDEWQSVLESLANGEITVDEADALLDTIEARKAGG